MLLNTGTDADPAFDEMFINTSQNEVLHAMLCCRLNSPSTVPTSLPFVADWNGDGINDKFEIKGLSKYQTVEIEIFNRNGNMVYHSINYGEGKGKDGFWDGTVSQSLRFSSGPVPSGTYFYVLKLIGKQSINGSIYIGRLK